MAKTDIEFQDTKKVELLDYVKKKRRWAFFWGALVASILLCIIFTVSSMEPNYPPRHEQIARVTIEGVIYDDDYRLEMLREIEKRDDVKALIVEINSPGGTVFASEELYQHIRDIGEQRPVVSLMRDSAASGGYITALAGDYLIAGETSVTGSIGVISEIPNITELMDNIGVSTTLTRSSEGKGGISPTHNPTPQELKESQDLIDAMYGWFRDLVGERRELSGNALASVSQGAAYTGAQALELGLIDELGGEKSAVDYLNGQDSALENLEIVDWEPNYPNYAPEAYVQSLAEHAKSAIFKNLTDAQMPSFQAILK